MKSIFQVFFIILFLNSTFSYAFENNLEFESLMEEESQSFEKPKGAEYQSDILTYQKPDSWEYDYLKSDIALDTSFGSISGENFMTNTRMKAKKRINSLIETRFTYFDEKDFEHFSNHFIAEFIFWINNQWGFGIYGEPSFRKAQDDIGIAAYYHPKENSEFKLFVTAVDLTRYRRNDKTDTFDKSHLPYAIGLISKSFDEDGSFLQYGMRYETKTNWKFPDQNLNYEYKKASANAYMRRPTHQDHFYITRIQWDEKLENRSAIIPSSTPTAEAWTNRRVLILTKYQIINFMNYPDVEFKPGLLFAHRDWLTTNGNLYYNDIIPNVSFKLPSKITAEYKSFWELGLDTTFHQFSGADAIDTPGDKNRTFESRFNSIYELNLKSQASLRLIATFDLDRIGKSDIFQGGCGQFKISF